MLKNAQRGRIMDIIEEVENKGIRFIQLQFMDILGNLKAIMIPATKLPDALDIGIHFDGSSVVGYATIDESDMILRPDPKTFQVLPWTIPETALEGKPLGQATAGIICNVCSPDNKPFQGDPRTILMNHMARAREKGYIFNTGPEIEFFLFKQDNARPSATIGDYGGYFDLLSARNEQIITEIIYYQNLMGFDVEAYHHEVAPSQYEIDPKYTDAMTSADRVLMVKYSIKTLAARHGMYATFMPKPIYGVCGSGMHINQSLFRPDGTNAFYDPDGQWQLSETALSYLSGLLNHARDNCALMASWVNSYKRLVVGYEAPVYISWSNMNRSALIRIPAGREKSTRIEQRNPDPAGNPYLQFAVMLASGMEGIEDHLTPPEPVEKHPQKPHEPARLMIPEPVEGNIFKLSVEERNKLGIRSLPSNLGEALNYLEKSDFMWEVLGPSIMKHFLRVKKKEYDDYRTQVTNWELETLLPIL